MITGGTENSTSRRPEEGYPCRRHAAQLLGRRGAHLIMLAMLTRELFSLHTLRLVNYHGYALLLREKLFSHAREVRCMHASLVLLEIRAYKLAFLVYACYLPFALIASYDHVSYQSTLY